MGHRNNLGKMRTVFIIYSRGTGFTYRVQPPGHGPVLQEQEAATLTCSSSVLGFHLQSKLWTVNNTPASCFLLFITNQLNRLSALMYNVCNGSNTEGP